MITGAFDANNLNLFIHLYMYTYKLSLTILLQTNFGESAGVHIYPAIKRCNKDSRLYGWSSD